jgi:putative serine protease PepD
MTDDISRPSTDEADEVREPEPETAPPAPEDTAPAPPPPPPTADTSPLAPEPPAATGSEAATASPPIAGFEATVEPSAPPSPPAPTMAPPVAGTVPPAVPPGVTPTGAATAAATQPPKRAGVGSAIVIAAILALVIGAFAGLAGGFLGARLAGDQGTGSVKATSVTVVPSKTPEPVVPAAAAALPSVVNIDVTGAGQEATSSALPEGHPNVPVSGNGSGVAYKATADGGTYIITNNHVVENAAVIVVKSPNGGKWTAKLVGRDPDTDIAVVKVSGKLPTIKVADSNKLEVGQMAIAIGSPYGLEHSVTSGVISALNRSLLEFGNSSQGQYPLVDVIQTDAAINPGNSGGALVDRLGKLIGINTAIYGGSTDANAGIGFAIPSNTAVRVADQLISGGQVQHPFIGIIGETVTAQTAQSRKLGVDQGALVVDFTSGSPAKTAGIKTGDVIVSLGGQPISSMDDLVLQVRRHSVGETVQVGIVRNGQKQTVAVKIGEKPAGLNVSPSQPATP